MIGQNEGQNNSGIKHTEPLHNQTENNRIINRDLKNNKADNTQFEIDKAKFGEFISTQRKKMGYTQKDLADRLFLSDKAISKWERGLSLPDISLLIPLAGILNVTVTELLEAKTADRLPDMDAGHVEDLLKKTLAYSAPSPAEKKKKKITLQVIFGLCMTAVIVELKIFFQLGYSVNDLLNNNLLTMMLLGSMFAAYAFLGAKDRLPAYYDENEINFYSDGIFRMNCAGVSFNNSNWPYILLSMRIWSVIQTAVLPACYLYISRAYPNLWHNIGFFLQLTLLLGGLFAPIYILGKKFG